jgi:GntR family transcriptional regulator / MocR family aminotransferase
MAGLHLSATFRRGDLKLEREVVERAKAAGVGLVTLSRYYASTPAQPGLVLGYGSMPTARIDEGLRRLRTCLAAAAGTKRSLARG